MTIAKPNMHPFILATCAAALLAACNDKNEAAEDKLERAAETSATVAGPLPAALGLSEAQLLEADIVGADGKELGDVASAKEQLSEIEKRCGKGCSEYTELAGQIDAYVKG